MSSEIGNKALLRERAERLQILDVKGYPGRLATDVVQPVQEVDPRYLGPALAEQGPVQYGFSSIDLSALGTVDGEIVPRTDLISGELMNTKVLAIDLDYSVAVDVSPDITRQRLYISDTDFPAPTVNATYVSNHGQLFSSGASAVQYPWAAWGWSPIGSLPQLGPLTWDGLLPAGAGLRLEVRRANAGSGSTFPAGSTVIIRSAYIRWPVGTLRPI